MHPYPRQKLFGASHIILTQTAIYRKTDQIQFRTIFLYISQFTQEIRFALLNLLFGRLFVPMPIIQISRMEKFSRSHFQIKGNSLIRRPISPNKETIILISVTFFHEMLHRHLKWELPPYIF